MFVASVRQQESEIQFTPMNVYSLQEDAPWNHVLIDKMIINADTLCTGGRVGHAVAARKVNASCSNAKLRGKWIVIDSQSNSQYVINLAKTFPACLIATHNTANWIATYKKSSAPSQPLMMCIQCDSQEAQFQCGNQCINGVYCSKRCAQAHYHKHTNKFL